MCWMWLQMEMWHVSKSCNDVNVLEPMSYDMLPNIMFECLKSSLWLVMFL